MAQDDFFEAILPDEVATLALGGALASCLVPGLMVYLLGELGAGKTTLVRGVLWKCGYQGRVKSPSYSLLEPYELVKIQLYHADLYRFQDSREWLDSGLADCFDGRAVGFVEWPERGEGFLPGADLAVELALSGSGRRARVNARTDRGVSCLRCLKESYCGVSPP